MLSLSSVLTSTSALHGMDQVIFVRPEIAAFRIYVIYIKRFDCQSTVSSRDRDHWRVWQRTLSSKTGPRNSGRCAFSSFGLWSLVVCNRNCSVTHDVNQGSSKFIATKGIQIASLSISLTRK